MGMGGLAVPIGKTFISSNHPGSGVQKLNQSHINTTYQYHRAPFDLCHQSLSAHRIASNFLSHHVWKKAIWLTVSDISYIYIHIYIHMCIYVYIYGWWLQPLRKKKPSVGNIMPNIWKIKNKFQTTNHTYIHTYIYIYIHTYIHIYTHTYIHISSSSSFVLQKAIRLISYIHIYIYIKGFRWGSIFSHASPASASGAFKEDVILFPFLLGPALETLDRQAWNWEIVTVWRTELNFSPGYWHKDLRINLHNFTNTTQICGYKTYMAMAGSRLVHREILQLVEGKTLQKFSLVG